MPDTHAELAGSIDKLELHLLQIPARSVDHERLAQGDDTLLGSGNRALEYEEVVLDDTVVGEATHGCDGLLGNVVLGRGIVLISTRANPVDLLVELSSVVVTVY